MSIENVLRTREIRCFIDHGLDQLPEKMKRALQSRYGLNGGNKKKISMESFSKLEAKAIRKLRHPELMRNLVTLFEDFSTEIWSAVSQTISDAGSVVYFDGHQITMYDSLAGELRLLMDCIYGYNEIWLSAHAYRTDIAWFKSRYPDQKVVEKVTMINQMDWDLFSPVEIHYLLEILECDEELLALVLALSQEKLEQHRGYLSRQPMASQSMRIIRIHLYLLYKHAGKGRSTVDIVSDYNSIYEDDKITLEIAESLLKAKTHLFCASDDMLWRPVSLPEKFILYDDYGSKGKINDPDKTCLRYFFPRPWSDFTAADFIHEILEINGIMKMVDILNTFENRVDNRMTQESAAAAIPISKNVIEVAPNIFGLADEYVNIDPQTASSELLLNFSDCRKYVTRRYAGEPTDLYPLWTHAMERHWCKWAQENCEIIIHRDNRGTSLQSSYRKLYESLLFIAEPDKWQAFESEKEIWLAKKENQACYHFQMDYEPIVWLQVPTLQELFTVVRFIKSAHYVNYLQVNRIQARGMRTSAYAVPSLALLVILDALVPAGNWQQKHIVGPCIDELMEKMVQEIKTKGFLHWKDPTGLLIMDRLQHLDLEKSIGWIQVNDLKTLLHNLKEKPQKNSLKEANTLPKKKKPTGKQTCIPAKKPPAQIQLDLF
ncbi:MAG: hypothetical protein GY834_12635 [Bacteroidetes bacterium]|nr:hypothetical protein [Bacteroidota bacterium]